MSRLLSLVTTTTHGKCEEFINKVKEDRFNKIEQRQVSKFNRLVHKTSNKDMETSASSSNYNNQLQTSRGQYDQVISSNNNNIKWVVNLSKIPLSPPQYSVLGEGPNFAVTPKAPPKVDYISAIKSISHKLTEQHAQELKSDVNNLLKRVSTPKANLTKKERKALTELKRDPDRMVLTADKGVALIVIDKEEYKQKADNLLDQPTYKFIERDPTNKIKAKLILILRRLTRETGIDDI